MGLAWRGPAVGLSLCPWELGDGHVSHGSLRVKHSLAAAGSFPKQTLGLDAGFKGLRRAYFWRGQSAVS